MLQLFWIILLNLVCFLLFGDIVTCFLMFEMVGIETLVPLIILILILVKLIQKNTKKDKGSKLGWLGPFEENKKVKPQREI